tara:strand:- start:313 stop:522 length:210 start_codon:yes stop_codon:yes gene_type:complete
MKRITIEETDIKDGKEIVIDSESLNLCNGCAKNYVMDVDIVSIENTSYDGDCDDCGEFEEGVWKDDRRN